MSNPTFQDIPLDRLTPSPTNPRKHFDEAKLAELAESLTTQGVLQPLVVAGTEHARGELGADGLEIVCGERRWRAAQLAGLDAVPCRVGVFTRAEIVEIQAVENLQREDLTPLEEARGYQAMLDLLNESGQPCYTQSALARRLGLDPKTISHAVALLRLPAPTQALVDAGKLAPRTAGLIARIPGEAERKRAAEEVADQSRVDRFKPAGPMSYREAEAHIHAHYVRSLRECPFNPEDAALMPAAGACSGCPKRSGNCRADFPDLTRDDLCLDPACYREKAEAAEARLAALAKAKGCELVDGAAVFVAWEDKPTLPFDSEWVMLNQKPEPELLSEDGDRRKAAAWRTLVKGREVPIAMARHPKSGQVRELVRYELALAAALENGHAALFRPEVTRRHEASRSSTSSGQAGGRGAVDGGPETVDGSRKAVDREAQKAKREQLLRKRTARAAFDALCDAVTVRIDPRWYPLIEVVDDEPSWGDPHCPSAWWSSLLERAQDLADHGTASFYCERHELHAKDRNVYELMRGHLNEAPAETHPVLALLLLFGGMVADGRAVDDDAFTLMLKAYAVDLAEIAETVEDELAAEEKAKAAKAQGSTTKSAKGTKGAKA